MSNLLTDDEIDAWTPPHVPEPDDDLLSSTDVCQRAGITYRQLDYWARLGVVAPVVDCAGSGTQRRWDREQVRDFIVLSQIADLTGSIAPGAGVVGEWRLAGRPDGPTGVYLVIHDRQPHIVDEQGLLDLLDLSGGALIAIAPPPRQDT